MVRASWYDEEPSYFGTGSSAKPWSSVVKVILILNVAIFVIDHIGGPGWLAPYLGLNCELIRTGLFPLLLIQLVTYQFMHGGLWHILINMLILWFFGRELETHLGTRRFLLLYLLSGVAGGLLQLVGSLLAGGEPLPLVVGASGAVFGVLVYFAFTWPNRPVLMFPIMVPIKARTLALIFVGISVLYGLFPESGDMTSHLGHLGGAIFGFLFHRYERKVKFAVEGVRVMKREAEERKSMDRDQEIDRLLTKIHDSGINSLTDAERKFLNKASQGYRKR
jgi:membrane associated rhomboid family serine protease